MTDYLHIARCRNAAREKLVEELTQERDAALAERDEAQRENEQLRREIIYLMAEKALEAE